MPWCHHDFVIIRLIPHDEKSENDVLCSVHEIDNVGLFISKF